MGTSIAVFNTKGGVGKSTTVMMLAETLSEHQNKRVLVIDADPQTSVSIMLTPKSDDAPEHLKEQTWDWAAAHKKTILDYVRQSTTGAPQPTLADYTVGAVSDLQAATTIDLLPGHMELALLEYDLIEAGSREKLQNCIASLISEASLSYDIVLIDCSPGITPLTQLWLEHVDFYLSPTTPNYLGIRGLSVTGSLKKRFDKKSRRFAPSLGALITMKGPANSDQTADQEIRAREKNAGVEAFPKSIPRLLPIQTAANYVIDMRSFIGKYPGGGHDLSSVIREFGITVLERIKPKKG